MLQRGQCQFSSHVAACSAITEVEEIVSRCRLDFRPLMPLSRSRLSFVFPYIFSLFLGGDVIMQKPDLDTSLVSQDVAEAKALLRDGLAEAQTTVRSYDTKAQIVGVGYIFSLGIVGQISALLDRETQIDAIGILISWAVVVMPILFFGYVLYPTRKTTSYSEATKHHNIQHVLYLDPTKKKTIAEVRQASLAAVSLDELSFELLMVSTLREIKRRRFLRGLFASGLSFLLLFLDQVFRSGWTQIS
jgi:hypothetical protein